MTATNDRWVVACHESAHAIAGHVLGGRLSGLALTANGGLAGVEGLHGDRHAFMTAAGPAAEHLASEHPAPELPVDDDEHVGDRTATVADDLDSLRMGLHVARFGSHPGEYPSDDRSLALWAITSHEDDPDSWARRIRFARHVADEIIVKNAGTVLRVATELFIRGRLSRVEIENLLKGA